MNALFRIGLVTLLWLSPLCAVAQDDETTQTAAGALLRDLDRIVELQQQAGWEVDHYEYEAMLPTMMRSVCRTPQEARQQTSDRVKTRIEAAGGDPAVTYQGNGGDLEDMDEQIFAWRTGVLLEKSLKEIERCPFWMQPHKKFVGLHSEEGRWSVHLEGGGLVAGRTGEELRFGAGGSGRAAVGYGISPTWDLRMGIGIGGVAMADTTVATENFVFDFFMAAPVIVRHIGTLWRQEIEVAPLILGIPWLGPQQFGLRVGGLIGVSYLRVRNVLPWVGLGISVEHAFARDNLPQNWTLRAGFRFGFSWASSEN